MAAQREYELVLMLDPGLDAPAREALAQNARGQIEGTGSLKHENSWGLRKMAYEIDRRTEADYRWFRFEAPSELLDSLDHNLKIADGVLRFRIFKVDPSAPVIVPPAVTAAPGPRERGSGPREDRGESRGEDRGAAPESAEPRREAPPAAPEAPAEPATAQESPAEPAEAQEAPAEPTADAPAEASDAPAESTDAPAEPTEAPAETADAPAEGADAPAEVADAPAEGGDAAAESSEAAGDVVSGSVDE